jgi:membrane protein DedA with SNARE-associated domain
LSNAAGDAANDRLECDGRMTLEGLSGLVAHYGYLVVFASALVGSAGIPLPATELLVAAAVYAAHTHRLDVVALAAGAAVMSGIGGLVGYCVGRSVGAATLARHGSSIGLGPSRLRLGQYLFLTHGGKIVFFIRFIAFLGPFGGMLAGANRMPLTRFAIFNALGSVTWAACISAGGYLFGTFFASVGRPMGLAALALAAVLAVAAFVYIHQRGAALQAKADAALQCENLGG